MYREDDGKGRKRPYERAADEAIRTKRPDAGGGVAGKGKGGKIGATGGTILTQYILKNQVRSRITTIIASSSALLDLLRNPTGNVTLRCLECIMWLRRCLLWRATCLECASDTGSARMCVLQGGGMW